jgi:oligopeptidase B
VFDFDAVSRERTLLKQVVVPGGYDPSRYVVERRVATANDGTAIPLWTLRRKDVALDGKNPALLYGYGSYGIAMNASFTPNVFSLVDRGVVYAMAYVRGGGELGKAWHDAGRMTHKPNTFTDFIAATWNLPATAGRAAATTGCARPPSSRRSCSGSWGWSGWSSARRGGSASNGRSSRG